MKAIDSRSDLQQCLQKFTHFFGGLEIKEKESHDLQNETTTKRRVSSHTESVDGRKSTDARRPGLHIRDEF
jgi:hypothetical protein